MATVYLAHDLKHDRPVAVKVLRPEIAASLGAERFLREIAITARLNHPHILTPIDSGEADGFLFYVVPYILGESLRARLDRDKQLFVKARLSELAEADHPGALCIRQLARLILAERPLESIATSSRSAPPVWWMSPIQRPLAMGDGPAHAAVTTDMASKLVRPHPLTLSTIVSTSKEVLLVWHRWKRCTGTKRLAISPAV